MPHTNNKNNRRRFVDIVIISFGLFELYALRFPQVSIVTVVTKVPNKQNVAIIYKSEAKEVARICRQNLQEIPVLLVSLSSLSLSYMYIIRVAVSIG